MENADRKETDVYNDSSVVFPKLDPRPTPASDSFPFLLTKPKILRKKDSEIKRYKELVTKKSIDCANAISGEQLSIAREAQLRRKVRELKTQNRNDMKVEKLRSKEIFLNETEQLRWQKDEALGIVETKDAVIRKLRMRVRQMEVIEKQKEKDIKQMKLELEMKNVALKTLLRKLVLAKFTKK
ncbi:uncharacterized protein LOC114534046 [Dendronephthya gigantea]|uniref:uncharacterized protein LOC114534046 n=1 Tax=Dendronephthya gigantea TaxID=151771 RepID=UPI00106D4560|nr:uncharacterized protein LOC114534046 [Dendronephthya gigantea]